MSRDRAEQQEALSLKTPPGATEKTAEKQDKKEAAGKLWTPEKREAKPAKLTAEQYLKTANVNEGTGGLIRAMHGAKIMPFAEWETLIKTILKKQVK